MKQPQHHSSQMYDLCKNHMHHYVLLETSDGSTIDGIITDVDELNVYLAIPNTMPEMEYTRQYIPSYGYGGYPYGGYPYGPRPPYGPYPGQGRFRRLVLPLAALTALSILPWY
ncbi:hypothetical protein BN1058_01283 [Paraliobacillus sp. PM-2]|uniref:hypothetical protein n=1 Tax=Paraliobacillus sp. PM-2 TaxID=1462524 RepID=UPI00061C34FD|nr:hypothetical protein [Paraliobacillus sp. PM-2]CQR46994.1 hypothetical protein BN1058_01283 [Paraliobacillus sp. PM-2]